MFKGNFTTGSEVTANTNIPITQIWNTNNKISLSTDNTIQLKANGLYIANANLVVTNVAVGNVTAQIYADGVAVNGAIASATSGATTDLITLPLQDALRVVLDNTNSFANISVQCNVAVTPTSGNILVWYER